MIETYFDTIERTEQKKILTKNKLISNYEIMHKLLECYPQLALVLDSNRQIVSANNNALKFMSETNLSEVLGKRLGEAFYCIHSSEMKAGCGTSIFCTECGAGKALKETREKNLLMQYECRITSKKNNILNAFDLRVVTTPFQIGEENFIVVYIENIEAEKRKDSLERVFFHDILNTAGAIKSIVEILDDTQNKQEFESFVEMLKISSNQLLNEIIFQRMIINAEKNELVVNLNSYSINSILDSIYSLHSKHQKAEGKLFSVNYLSDDLLIETDKTILVRSLGNLVKNALEATNEGDKVNLYAELKNDFVDFVVWNKGVIPENVQLQIFQRSFSTKAKSGRGIGTYSVKLFVENYLKGKVYFISSEENQTSFIISLPLKRTTE